MNAIQQQIPDLRMADEHLAQALLASASEIAWFFDFDGTLAPIVDSPEKACLSSEMSQILEKLSRKHLIAFVSGRERKDVKARVSLEHAVYAGCHGLDIGGPGGLTLVKGNSFKEPLERFSQKIESLINGRLGVVVERKSYSTAIHFRLALQNDKKQIVQDIFGELEAFSELKHVAGKEVIEVKPCIDWHKGKAIEWILSQWRQQHHHLFPVFLGDDLTDEDGFAVTYPHGLGIVISRENRMTAATKRLDHPKAVEKWLSFFL